MSPFGDILNEISHLFATMFTMEKKMKYLISIIFLSLIFIFETVE